VPGAVPPTRSSRTQYLQPLHHAVTDTGSDARQELALQQPELCRPCGGRGLNGQFTVTQRNRTRMFGDVFTDQLRPPAEHLSAG
jgi:hypothetical protein